MQRDKLFEPDVVASDTWNSIWHGGSSLSNEKRLMVAVLKSALVSYQKYAFSRSADDMASFQEAAAWIDSNETTWFFSFRNICENLDIAPEQLRNRLSRWRRRVEDGDLSPEPASVE